MQKEQFFRLKKNDYAWRKVQKMVAYRKFRQLADDIDPTPIDEVKQKNMVEFKKYGEPDLLEVFMGDRPEEKGIIKPYAEHPLYIQKLNESARRGKDTAFGSEG